MYYLYNYCVKRVGQVGWSPSIYQIMLGFLVQNWGCFLLLPLGLCCLSAYCIIVGILETSKSFKHCHETPSILKELVLWHSQEESEASNFSTQPKDPIICVQQCWCLWWFFYLDFRCLFSSWWLPNWLFCPCLAWVMVVEQSKLWEDGKLSAPAKQKVTLDLALVMKMRMTLSVWNILHYEWPRGRWNSNSPPGYNACMAFMPWYLTVIISCYT